MRGCLNPDSSHYAVSYVSQSGRNEECLDERVTLRDLQPFKNIIKVAKLLNWLLFQFNETVFHLQFSVRRRELGHQMFKRSIGKLIGKNLREFDDLRNVQGCNSMEIYNLG